MPIYVGETTRIQTEALQFNGEVLTDEDVTGATVEIWRLSDSIQVLSSEPMIFDEDEGVWYYDWDTGGATPQAVGRYLARCRIVGIELDTWEYVRFRLNENPVEVA